MALAGLLIGIVGILGVALLVGAGFAVTSQVQNVIDDHVAACQADTKSVETAALEAYQAQNNSYPPLLAPWSSTSYDGNYSALTTADGKGGPWFPAAPRRATTWSSTTRTGTSGWKGLALTTRRTTPGRTSGSIRTRAPSQFPRVALTSTRPLCPLARFVVALGIVATVATVASSCSGGGVASRGDPSPAEGGRLRLLRRRGRRSDADPRFGRGHGSVPTLSVPRHTGPVIRIR